MAQENAPTEADKLLIAAVQTKHIKNVADALKKKANPDACDGNGYSAIAIASALGLTYIADVLLRGGANPNKAGNQKCVLPVPPVVLALENNYFKILTLLLDHKADPNAKSIAGETLLEIAVFTQDELKVEVLLAYGAKVTPGCTKKARNKRIKQMLDNYEAGTFVSSIKPAQKEIEPKPNFKTPLPELDVNSLIGEFNKDFWSTKPLPEFDPHLFNAEFKKETGHYFNVLRKSLSP